MPGTIRSMMPAMVLKLCVKSGETFSSGDVIAILESMKMEIPIEAEVAGKVDKILVGEGDAVEENDIILIYE